MRKYEILVSLGFPMLVFEVAEYYTAQALHVSKDGEVLGEEPGRVPEFSAEKIQSLVKEAIALYVSQSRKVTFSPEIQENIRRRVFEEAEYPRLRRRYGISIGMRAVILLFSLAH